ncbi:MAG: outer membrane protein assembly factor BamD [Pseudomonadota bacterium]
MIKLKIIAVLLIFLLPACSMFSGNEEAQTAFIEEIEKSSAESLFAEAEEALNNGEYLRAIPLYEKVEQEFPYSNLATKSQLKAAFAAYQADEYTAAIIGLDRFIQLHPGNEEIDYAFYLKSLVYYEQISDVARDQELTTLALKAFDTLIARFPDSEYIRDARLKRDLTLDHLAGKEMSIGRYYLKRNQINSAINRFQTVVENYQTTTHVAEALHRLVESYLTLGLRGEAIKVASVLGHNYPGSKWYQDTYKILDEKARQRMIEDQSLMNRAIGSVFRDDE